MDSGRPPQFRRPPRARWPWVVLAVAVVGLAAANHRFQWVPWPWAVSRPADLPTEPVAPTPSAPNFTSQVLDYGKLRDGEAPAMDRLITERKEEYGLDHSVDMVVENHESIKVGEETVSIQDILAAIDAAADSGAPIALPVLDRPEVQEEDLNAATPPPTPPPANPEKRVVEYYGVYVVRSGDDLWDIHFAFLREYLKHRGVEIPPDADQTRHADGTSNWVSRILKYAESMVHIYNMKTRSIDTNLDTLSPDSKVVIFNITRLHRILGAVDAEHLPEIEFDGKELILPGTEPKTP